MKNKKTFLILGLGIFGSTISRELRRYHHDVIAIDKEMVNVERISEFVANAVCADFTDIDQLRSIGVDEVDAAVVATGSHLEESVLAIMNLKELNVPFILAKAKNKKYAEVLKKVGADRVITPEKEMGKRMAKALLAKNIYDVVDIDDEYSIVEIEAPHAWINKNLIQLDLRNKYKINILGIKKVGDEHLTITPEPYYVIAEHDRLLVIVSNAFFKDSKELEKVSD